MRINNNTILITGGGSGIGLSLAKAFLLAKNTVLIIGRDQVKLEKVKKENPEIFIFNADITDESSRLKLLEHVNKNFPKLNILVNNAAINSFYDFKINSSISDIFQKEMATNLVAPIQLFELFKKQLINKDSSTAIINISSLAAVLPIAMTPAYSASKAAMHSFTVSLRFQLAETKLKIFEILPSAVDTGMSSAYNLKKLSPDLLALKIIDALKKNHYEVYIGEAKLFALLSRLAPKYIFNIVQKFMDKKLYEKN